MEGKHRVAGWDRKESNPCRLRRLHKGLQIEIEYFMRTIDSFEDHVEPIDEDDIFLPVLFSQTETLPDELA